VKDSSAKPVILVVDDDTKCREALSELLAREGYEVACAENGHDALDYLSRSLPSLIILDLMMPVLSGWEFRKQQLSDPRLNSLPLVITTASALAHEIDADAVVPKPIDFAVLMTAVRKNCKTTNPFFQSMGRRRPPSG
jgi:CheY-like chemotaxis protein